MTKLKPTSNDTLKQPERDESEEVLDFGVSEGEEQIAHGGEDDAPISAYEDRYVAFIDILGFKELIFASSRDDSAAGPSLIFNALDIRHGSVQDAFLSRVGIGDAPDLDFIVQSFSDCVVASCKKTRRRRNYFRSGVHRGLQAGK